MWCNSINTVRMSRTTNEGLHGRVELARLRAGLSARETDRRAGLPIGVTRAVERQIIASPRIGVISGLATALGVSIDWLAFGEVA